MATIKKKIWPDVYDSYIQKEKKIELRLADFDLHEGDEIIFQEWNPETGAFTGREFTATVSQLTKLSNSIKYYKEEEVDEHGLYAFVVNLKD